MTRTEPAWTFYGRQECGCCEEAANLLLLLLDGHPVTLRMIDLHGPEEAPAPVHRLPALMDQSGRIVWQGSFDSRATEQAWQAIDHARTPSQRHRNPRERDAHRPAFLPDEEAPIPNGLQ